MPTQNVNLPEHQADFIRQSVEGGRYGSASEVVRAGLRLLEQQERENVLKLEALGQAVGDGFAAIEAGESVTLENEEELAAWFAARGTRRRPSDETRPEGGAHPSDGTP